MTGSEFRTKLKNLKLAQRALGRFLGITGATINGWVRVPDIHVNKVSEFTGIPNNELRPDVFDQ